MRFSTSLFFLAFAALSAQTAADWRTATELPALDQTGLSTAQKSELLKLLRAEPCNCGCSMKIAECRVRDPNCTRSRGLAALAVRELQEGKTSTQVKADLNRRTNEAPPVLDEPVPLSVGSAPSKGPANARITIIEFSDFQCPYCAAAVGRLYSLLAKHPADVRLVFKQFPLDTHSSAQLAAEAALAAHAQGKFWPMHDKLYENFRSISAANIGIWAKAMGMDMQRFDAEMKSGKYKAAVQREQAEGEQAGVQGTPTLFINGKHFNGPIEVELLETVIQSELKALTAGATASPRSR